MEKVTIPKEVAEAIEFVWNALDNKKNIKHIVMNNWNFLFCCCSKHTVDKLLNYAKENPNTYMTALVHGYEVEKTKEEKILGYYNYSAVKEEAKALRQCVIKNTLDLLEIKIEGINS